MTWQELASGRLRETYRHQKLLTLAEAMSVLGWDLVDHPTCCGVKVHIESLLCDAYYAQCGRCGRKIADALGPVFEGGAISIPDTERVVGGDPARSWIAILPPMEEDL